MGLQDESRMVRANGCTPVQEKRIGTEWYLERLNEVLNRMREQMDILFKVAEPYLGPQNEQVAKAMEVGSCIVPMPEPNSQVNVHLSDLYVKYHEVYSTLIGLTERMNIAR